MMQKHIFFESENFAFVQFALYLYHCKTIYDMISIGMPPGGSSTIHIYAQTVYGTAESTQTIHRTTHFTNQEECGPCSSFACYTVAFALQLNRKQGKTSVRVVGECQLAR